MDGPVVAQCGLRALSGAVSRQDVEPRYAAASICAIALAASAALACIDASPIAILSLRKRIVSSRSQAIVSFPQRLIPFP